MNFESIKNKFIQMKLEELRSNPRKKDLTEDDISIFKYADEFEEFACKELNIDADDLNIDVETLLSMELNELDNLVNPNKDNNDSKENTTSNFLTDFINSIFGEKDVKEKVDTDGDGKISDKEKENFLKTIASMDKEDGDVSMEDLFKTGKRAEKGRFKIKETEETPEAAPAGSSSGGGSVGGGTNPPPSNNNNTDNKDSSSVPNFENMTTEEIKAELDTADQNVQDGKEIAGAILDGSYPELQEKQKKIDESYDKYHKELETLDKDMAKELDRLVKDVADKEKIRDDKLKQIVDQTVAVSDAECAYTEAQQTTKSLNETKTEVQGQLDSLVEPSPSAYTTTDENGNTVEDTAAYQAALAEYQAQKQALEQQINQLEQDIKAAEKAEEDAKLALDQANTKLEQLNDESKQASDDVTDAVTAKAEYEKQIVEKHPEVKQLQTDYNNAKTEYDTFKANEITAAMSFIDKNQSVKNAAKLELNKRENEEKAKEVKKDLKIDPMLEYDEKAGQKLKEAALTTRGTTGLCLAGVHESLLEAYGINTKLPFGSAYMATEYFRGNVEGYEEIAQHFKEVEVSESDLSSLPAGAVVIWDKGGNSSVSSLGKEHGHISISLGDGRESSDHIQDQITGRGVKFYVFIPVS